MPFLIPRRCLAPERSPGGGKPAWYALAEGGHRYPVPSSGRIGSDAIIIGYDTGEVWDDIVRRHEGDPWSPRQHAQQDA